MVDIYGVSQCCHEFIDYKWTSTQFSAQFTEDLSTSLSLYILSAGTSLLDIDQATFEMKALTEVFLCISSFIVVFV